MLKRLSAHIRAEFDRRLFRLKPAERYPVTLVQRRIFVLPTRAGLMFGITLIAMLLASINYSLNLGFALTFLLAGMGLTSTFHAFRNLLGLEISAGHDDRGHQGDLIRYELRVSDRANRPRIGLRVIAAGDSAHVSIASGAVQHVRLAQRADRRGINSIGRVVVETTYPLGLVRAWSVLTPDHKVLVYPAIAKEAPSPTPSQDISSGEQHDTQREGSDDFSGLRPYRESDSPRQVAWKAVARSDSLVSKAFSLNAGERLLFSWEMLPARLDTESRLSRLTRWVVDAAAAGSEYTLGLPGISIGPGHDAVHRDRCLEALALFGSDDA